MHTPHMATIGESAQKNFGACVYTVSPVPLVYSVFSHDPGYRPHLLSEPVTHRERGPDLEPPSWISYGMESYAAGKCSTPDSTSASSPLRLLSCTDSFCIRSTSCVTRRSLLLGAASLLTYSVRKRSMLLPYLRSIRPAKYL